MKIKEGGKRQVELIYIKYESENCMVWIEIWCENMICYDTMWMKAQTKKKKENVWYKYKSGMKSMTWKWQMRKSLESRPDTVWGQSADY